MRTERLPSTGLGRFLLTEMTNDLMNDNACNLMLSDGDSRTQPLVVLKLGGSLLKCTDLADRIRLLIATLQPKRILIVVGGGDAADVVRDWSDRFSLSEEMAHWLAIRSLSLTRGLVKELLPECEEVETPSAAAEVWDGQQRPVLLKMESYLRQAEVNEPSPLPHTWDVTSDSIAAWVATQWGADQLILLKSVELPAEMDLEQAGTTGLVDGYFPIIARKVTQIRWCNLLTDGVVVQDWQTQSGQHADECGMGTTKGTKSTKESENETRFEPGVVEVDEAQS